MHRILISACLLGQKVRYDGADKFCDSALLQRWSKEGRLLPLCPEVAGGFPVPRAPAEISNAQGGRDVLNRKASVFERSGRNVTAGYIAGAQAALQLVKTHGVRVAILKEGSPSCGSGYTYDGSFSGGTTQKPGVTAALLEENGVFVFSELELVGADALIRQLEASSLG